MDIQRKKENFGESWKYSIDFGKDEELKKVVGDFKAPQISDSIDINSFFKPIYFLTETIRGEEYKKYFNSKTYEEAEEAYNDALKNINDELKEIDEKEKEEELKDQVLKTPKKRGRKKKEEELPRDVQRKLFKISNYFNRTVPLYNRYVCSCCGQPLEEDNFFVQVNELNLAHTNEKGTIYSHICKNCCKKLYEYLYYEKATKDPVEAMKWFCSYLNIYYNDLLYYQAKSNMKKNDNKNHIVTEYLAIINSNPEYQTKTFLESDNLKLGSSEEKVSDSSVKEWTEQDKKNRRLVIKMVGYDPFDYETTENRKILYKDLLGILENGMEMDEIKLQAGIQIVISFLKIKEINKIYRKKQDENADPSELKALSDLKNQELKSITSFSKDNGFSERYANAKSKGENTFTGIMNKMSEYKYEDALVNKYDIATSETIQQAADASFKAIMNQLSLGEAEVWKTCKEQLGELEQLRRENFKLQEDIRKAKYELAKIELKEKAKEKGIDVFEDDDFDDFDEDLEDKEDLAKNKENIIFG